MNTQYDRSDNDKKYFIDGSVYNCPFCNRRHVSYRIISEGEFNKSNTQTTYYYLVRCMDCRKTSFHLSKYQLLSYKFGDHPNRIFAFPPRQITTDYSNHTKPKDVESDIVIEDRKIIELDELFFYHQPTGFFTIDERIPKIIREPLCEADNCLNSNFLIGASGCLRKAIYKLLQYEEIPEFDENNTNAFPHDKRVDLLKEKYQKIDPMLDELKAIHILTSQELHENDWKDFDGVNLRFLIEVTKEILTEIYVTPDEAKKRRENLSKLKQKAKSVRTKK